MSLTAIFDGLRIDSTGRQATGDFFFDTRDDLPERGADASAWVTDPAGSPIGTGWYVAAVLVRSNPAALSALNIATLTARQAGYDWTWIDPDTGAPLRQIDRAPAGSSSWALQAIPDFLTSGKYTLANMFGNWDHAWDWLPGDPSPLEAMSCAVWCPEFCSLVNYASRQLGGWRGHCNGPWPGSVRPPNPGARNYYCRTLDFNLEPYYTVDGRVLEVWRHLGTFWQAPYYDAESTQLTWASFYPTWV